MWLLFILFWFKISLLRMVQLLQMVQEAGEGQSSNLSCECSHSPLEPLRLKLGSKTQNTLVTYINKQTIPLQNESLRIKLLSKSIRLRISYIKTYSKKSQVIQFSNVQECSQNVSFFVVNSHITSHYNYI